MLKKLALMGLLAANSMANSLYINTSDSHYSMKKDLETGISEIRDLVERESGKDGKHMLEEFWIQKGNMWYELGVNPKTIRKDGVTSHTSQINLHELVKLREDGANLVHFHETPTISLERVVQNYRNQGKVIDEKLEDQIKRDYFSRALLPSVHDIASTIKLNEKHNMPHIVVTKYGDFTINVEKNFPTYKEMKELKSALDDLHKKGIVYDSISVNDKIKINLDHINSNQPVVHIDYKPHN